MIVEFFYPKELRNVLDELKVNDDLDDKALNYFNRDMIRKLGMLVFLSFTAIILSLFTDDISISFFFVALAIGIIVFTFFNISKLNRFVLPYTCGHQAKAKVVGADYEFFPFHGYTGWSIRYEFVIDQRKYSGNCVGVKADDLHKSDIEQGDEIIVFYLQENPSDNAPFLTSKYNIFSLKKPKEL